ncbi:MULTISPECIES: glutathione S-transferase family protein [Marinomonas]|uniref:Glutathione S-transferase family protein n=1 Tax=Marinomonas arctica TaxID=383750 RepID=A0A7H1J7D6_9GAMM|nr:MULTISPECIES: glutathione S-transferase family protein [Marinomonas]MCS7485785.1 glutathione S-transferase [Marinomonas sp. BSi20414]QNT06402.1 glutathione S-transferase family protein [Marinomonas arctica]GGN28133.1 glutathione S-transferase [Marinomonas arctica]
MKLIIGNKNYSSWSLRGWLALKAFNIPFEEIKLSLFSDEFRTELAKYTPVSKVPVLVDGDLSVWDSLAICEYINENYLDGKGWPADKNNRAVARSIVADMHSGLFAIRNEMPMNCRAKRRVELSDKAKKEAATLDALWSGLRTKHAQNGDYLFGEFSFADVFFAPVVFRFSTYGVQLSDAASAYHKTMLARPDMQAWLEDSVAEIEIISQAETGEAI